MLNAVKPAVASIKSLRETADSLKTISQDMNRSTSRLTLLLDRIIRAMEMIESGCSKAFWLIQDKKHHAPL